MNSPAYDFRRNKAMNLLEQIEDNPDATPEQRTALALAAIANTLLAVQASTPAKPQQTGPVMTVVILLVLAAVILGSVWIIAG